MSKRIGPAPANATYPVWAWYLWAGPEAPCPDLRYRSTRESAENGGAAVLLTLEVPDDHVVLTDYEAWHHVINYWYLGSARETSEFDGRCKAAGLSYYHTKPLANRELHAEIQTSWQKIIGKDGCKCLTTKAEREASWPTIQATFWELRPEYVRQAVWFQRTGPSRRLSLPARNDRPTFASADLGDA
ncbi:protein of unknown function [Cupriavidus sp. YR651]|nr:protein of unknown function [Cupriavidus sp. YR651]